MSANPQNNPAPPGTNGPQPAQAVLQIPPGSVKEQATQMHNGLLEAAKTAKWQGGNVTLGVEFYLGLLKLQIRLADEVEQLRVGLGLGTEAGKEETEAPADTPDETPAETPCVQPA